MDYLKNVKIMFKEDELQNRINQLATQIDKDYEGK